MKNLMFATVLFLSVSGFAENLMPPCEDADARTYVAANRDKAIKELSDLRTAGEQLKQFANYGVNQKYELQQLRLITGRVSLSDMTHVQYLAYVALSNVAAVRPNQAITIEVNVCPNERFVSLENLRRAQEVIRNIRLLMAAEAQATK